MKKRLIAVLLSVCMVECMLPISAGAASNWYDGYKDLVLNQKYFNYSGVSYSDDMGIDTAIYQAYGNGLEHCLYDLNGDSIPELIILQPGVTIGGTNCNVFSFQENQVVYLGHVSGELIGYDSSKKYPGLFFDLHHSYGQATYVAISNSRMKATEVVTYDFGTTTIVTKDNNLYNTWKTVEANSQRNRYTIDMVSYDKVKSLGWDAFVDKYGFSRPVQYAGFYDVSESDWFAKDVKYVSDKKLMTGTGNDLFSPNGKTTRGQAVTILYRLDGSPSVSGDGFSDVKSSDWFYKAVQWASKNGVASGYGNGRFGPNDTLNREQLATMLYRYAQFKKMNTTTTGGLSKFSDSGSVSGYALDAMSWAVGKGLISGTSDGKLTPGATATRAQLAAILHRFCENVK